MWSTAHRAPLTMEFCRQEHWSGLPFPSPKGGYHAKIMAKICTGLTINIFLKRHLPIKLKLSKNFLLREKVGPLFASMWFLQAYFQSEPS